MTDRRSPDPETMSQETPRAVPADTRADTPADAPAPPREIRLAIDRLVLDVDLRPGDADRLARAVEVELSRLLARPGAPALADLAVPSLRAPEIDLARDPAALGRAIARALATSLGGAP